MELLTIPFSHYNERARWAMQHHGIAADERRYLPMVHMSAVRRAVPPSQRMSDKTGSGLSTPVLVLDDGTVLNDSTRILHWADELRATSETTLYPDPWRAEIEAFEAAIHDDLGRDTRFLAYWFVLADGPAFSQLVQHNVSWWQRALFRVGGPLAKAGMRKRFSLTEAKYVKVSARLESELDRLSELLGDNPYYFGDRFTAADLTAASMLSPLLGPVPRYGADLPGLDGPFTALNERVLSSPAGAHARRMFERHRPAPPAGWTWT